MTRDLRIRAFVMALIFAATGIAAFGQPQTHRVTLHGKLFRAPDVECGFFLDPLGDSEGVQLFQVQDGNYLCDYLNGSDGRPFTITMGPESK